MAGVTTPPNPPPPTRCARLVKLGGAAVTVKNHVETLRGSVLQHTAETFAGAASAGRCDTVLVHGAGSFGHHPANEYGVARGGPGWPLTPKLQHGFAVTRASVTKLNGLVVQALVAAGCPAVGLSPLGLCEGPGTQAPDAPPPLAAAVSRLLAAGLLPVLHGDAVLDAAAGCAVLSGDTLVRQLAAALRPEFVVFLTNVPGVFDRPPEEPGALLLRRISVRPDGGWSAEAWPAGGAEAAGERGEAAPVAVRMSAQAHDVTGGIALKVEEAASIARLGIPVLIAQAGTRDGALAVHLGPRVLGQGGSGGWGAAAAAAAASAAGVQGVGGATGCGAPGQGAPGAGGAQQAEAGAAAAGAGAGAAGAGEGWRGTLVVLEGWQQAQQA